MENCFIDMFLKMTSRLSCCHLALFSSLLLVSHASPIPTYDFIIVGGGTAGCAVARRLVETGRFSVLLVEAGGVPKQFSDVPALAPQFLTDSDVVFNYHSIPQKNAARRTGGVVSNVSGKMLGGTSSLNYMWFNRGHPRDWDNWANVTGDESWKYENMMKYFKRVETYRGDFPSDQHGHNGPIAVSRPSYTPGLDIFLDAGRELGYHVGDPNGPQRRSFTPVEFSKRNGRRVSSYTGYLLPVLKNPNLKILTNTNVTEIIFEGNRAVGVRLISNTTTASEMINVAYATKEVIVSAGAFNSPLILQRSGVGPGDILRATNIPIIKKLLVGKNLRDHAAVNLNFAINNRSSVFNEGKELTQEAWEYFNNFGDGPYSNLRGATGQVFMTTSVAKEEGDFDWPEMQLCLSHSVIPYAGETTGLDAAAIRTLREDELPISLPVSLGRPKSCGSVSINPDNVMGPGIIEMGYLTDSRDMRMFLDAIREAISIFEHTRSYGRFQTRYVPITLPACDRFPVKSEQYWICYVRETTFGGFHVSGTNKMGSREDSSAVVDSELSVIGVEGLRVVDASIMPFVVNGNLQAAVYGIAEKAADIILKRWNFLPAPIKSPSRKINGNHTSHAFYFRGYDRFHSDIQSARFRV